MSTFNFETKEEGIVVNGLYVTSYDDMDVGTIGFQIGDVVIVRQNDGEDSHLAVITAVMSYYDDLTAYERFLLDDDEIQEFLNCPDADGSAEWIVDDDQYLVCWKNIATLDRPVSFEETKSWC